MAAYLTGLASMLAYWCCVALKQLLCSLTVSKLNVWLLFDVFQTNF